ncbi:MAG TPA: hypothetical protein VEA16_16735, partial [Vicinamibacterales bacterium]|nr:hypothetical protein [Vicinamibacterales bacterium]
GGQSWAPLTDTHCSLAIGSVAVDPGNPETIYAGTGDLWQGRDSLYGCGILKSTNGGASWAQLGASVFQTASGGARIAKIAIHPTSTSTLLIASDFGLFRSTDGGSNFTLVQAGFATDVVIDPATPSNMYAALGDPAGVAANGAYKSTDSGATWTKLTNGLPSADVGRVALALAHSTPETIYAAIANSSDGTLLGLYRSTDGGDNWSQRAATGATCADKCQSNMAIAVKPNEPDVVYFAGSGFYRSANAAASFVASGADRNPIAITVNPTSPSSVYVTTEVSLNWSSNEGYSFGGTSSIPITQVLPGPGRIPTGFANGVFRFEWRAGTSGNGLWGFPFANSNNTLACDDAGHLIVDQSAQPDKAWRYSLCEWHEQQSRREALAGPRRLNPDDIFKKYNRFVDGIDMADDALRNPPLVASPSDSQTLYFGTTKLYRTTNATASGPSWSVIGSTFTGKISAIAQAPSNAQVIYAGTDSGDLQRTTDGGANWVVANSGLPNSFIHRIVVHPTNSSIVFVAIGGFGTGHVWMSTNGGSGWTDISGNLPDVPVYTILLDPAAPATEMLIGTQRGVYRTANGGTTWSPFGVGLPSVPVNDLVIEPDTSAIVATTYGRGLWKAVETATPKLVVTPPPGSNPYTGSISAQGVHNYFVTSGPQGGPFRPSSFALTLQSPNGSVDFAVTDLPSWLSVSQSSGSVGAAPVVLTFTVNATANSMPAGRHQATFTVENTTNGEGTQQRTAILFARNSDPNYSLQFLSQPYGFNVNGLTAIAMSADGSVIAGSADNGVGIESRGIRWTNAGPELLDATAEFNPVGISADGNVIAGTIASSTYHNAAIWTGGTITTLNPQFNGTILPNVRGISRDGKTVIGTVTEGSTKNGVRWVNGGPAQNLGFLGTVPDTEPMAASADGSIIYGTGRKKDSFGAEVLQSFRWTEAGGIVGLGTTYPNHSPLSFNPWAASADGNVVLGDALWRQNCGIAPGIGRAVSADGNVVVGRTTLPNGQSRAFRWTRTGGIEDLTERLVTSGGLKMLGHVQALTEAVGVSDDGVTVVGNSLTGTGPWKVRVPLPVNPQPILETCADNLHFSSTGTAGGPLAPSTFQLKIRASHGSLDYSITTPSWLSASSTSGTLTTAERTITLTLNNDALSLVGGTYHGDITITNTTSGRGTQTRGISLYLDAGPTNTITLSKSPSDGGSVAGAGTFPSGVQRTVTATANEAFNFVNWTEGANVVSTQASYTFTLNANRNLRANFAAKPHYAITLNANPAGAGTLSGAGTFMQGTEHTVTAAPTTGYVFVNWKEGATVASS